jgi:uncharacterized protein involved in exopolysaccharide biosynthesis
MLSTETVEGTQVVLLRAEGPQRQFLARLVNTLTSAYQEHLAAAYQKSTGTGADQLRDSVRALEQKVAAKRQEVEAFRSSNEIVSTERDENQLLSAAKGLATDLNDAKGKLAAAEGQLRAARNAASSGQGSSPPRTTRPSRIWKGALRNCAKSCMICSSGSRLSIWTWTRR